MKKIRSPILTTLGHVDHGKTSLLDKIRGTAIAKGEPGLITQYISASYIPADVIKKLCGHELEKMKIEITIPGLLIIDTPGHEAFTTLRKRGGAIADLAILVIDVNEGFKPQTEESLNFLKQFKTPFVVAVTKIDRLLGWNPRPGCFLDSYNEQNQRTQDLLEEKVYHIIGQLASRGFEAERFDRVSDFSKQIALVPVSGITGEGIPDLLMILSGIAQKFLKKSLEITPGEGKGTILEVKEFRGLGTTIDVILYDGEIRRGDNLIIGATTEEKLIQTNVKALLEPAPLKELKAEKDFRQLESVTAAAGIKIAAPGLEGVVPGLPLRAVKNPKDVEMAKKEIEEEIEEVEIEAEKEGVLLKADTLGSLEALIKSLKNLVTVRKAHVGGITKTDIMEAKVMEKPVIFAFGIKPSQEITKLAEDNSVYIFSSDVIYRLIEDYKTWESESKKRREEKLLKMATRPGKIRVLPGYVFRQKKPAVFGIEVLAGTIRVGDRLRLGENIIGKIKEIQEKGENRPEAKTGNRVALSMEDVTVGKDVHEGDVLETYLSEKDLEILKKIKNKLRPDEKELLEERKENE